jgi:hypothetical protein
MKLKLASSLAIILGLAASWAQTRWNIQNTRFLSRTTSVKNDSYRYLRQRGLLRFGCRRKRKRAERSSGEQNFRQKDRVEKHIDLRATRPKRDWWHGTKATKQ